MVNYDAIIIGAGMSGLAAGIRLAMFDQKVCILEKHVIPGGLNSYYQRKGHPFDVGLHAMTNFSGKREKGPLTKLMKQLRLPYESFALSEQIKSSIQFPEHTLTFSNDFDVLLSEVREVFPHEIDSFLSLVEKIKVHNETDLDQNYSSAREVLQQYLQSSELIEMILCPLLIYGSAWEDDMDFSQFIVMFKSIFLQGFCRPQGGVRTIITLLVEKFKSCGGVIHYRSEVESFILRQNAIAGVRLKDKTELLTTKVFSSMGLPETYRILNPQNIHAVGRLSFTETIFLTPNKPRDFGQDNTIIFYNNRPNYLYQRPSELFDGESAVICFSNNFQHDDFESGIVRLTHIANYDLFKNLNRDEYRSKKGEIFERDINLMKKIMPGFNGETIFHDIFTPLTIAKFTSHFSGTVYGSPEKSRRGLTTVKGLYIIGTDQGFLGIVGSMLSGISMANLYGLLDEEES